MTALLIISHNRIGAEMLDTAIAMLGSCPMPAVVLSVSTQDDPDILLPRAREMLAALDQSDGAIILTDMFGSTPANIARALQRENGQVDVVAGLNLPMLVRLLNYPALTRRQLVDKALSGAHEGIFLCAAREGG